MMEPNQASEFPKYRDGDVAILVSASLIYQLHSSVLSRYSPFFARELGKKDPPRLNPAARREGLAAYRFELCRQGPDDIGNFVRKDVTESGRSARSNFIFPDLYNGKVADDKSRYWDWLFGSFYHRQPEFDDQNLATVLTGCMGLVEVAESIGSVDHVREIVDLALLRQDSTLWASIASNPTAWAELGRRVHSPMIFSEGVCHVVGKWQSMTEEEKRDLNQDTRDICERKFQQLDIAKQAIELRILGHYPTFLARGADNKPSRSSYATDIYMWMALSFFRQWFAQAISDGRKRVSPDGGYSFYHALAKGGQHYLDHDAFRNFHMYFPMSAKACAMLEANMTVFKEDIKPFVKDLVTERTHVKSQDELKNDKTHDQIPNFNQYPLQWLTCALIGKGDYPWSMTEEHSVVEDVFCGSNINRAELDDDYSADDED